MSLLDHYYHLCTDKGFLPDSDQLSIIKKLDCLKQKLAVQRTWFSWIPQGLFGLHKPLKGLYIHGGVGRGKTMMMDLFYDHLETSQKSRYHFHEFMQMIHYQMRNFSTEHAKTHHPLHMIAKRLRQDGQVLCFDEFHFKDITDAMLLKRLFSFLWKEGIVIVATSNFHPEALYKNGYQRTLIVPFLQELTSSFQVCSLEGSTDYRLRSRQKTSRHLVDMSLSRGQKGLWSSFQQATNQGVIETKELVVNGRVWQLPCVVNHTIFLSFDQICGDTVGSQDYLALVAEIRHVYLWGVPQLDDQSLDQVKRFITFIDILYDQGTELWMASQTPIETIYSEGLERSLFKRTESRLREMLNV